MRTPALLLDLGGTAFRSGAEMILLWARREPRVRAAAARLGPLGSETDHDWEQMLRQEISERDYWARRAAEFGRAVGASWRTPDLMHELYADPGEPILRPEAEALVLDARRAGIGVGALTNDLRAFHGDDVLSRHPLLRDLDALVDASVTGVLKPDPQAYAAAAAALQREPSEIVFVDDMPWNVEGAERFGMVGVLVDVAEPGKAFDEARRALGLGDRLP